MTNYTPNLTDRQALEVARATLSEALPLDADGYVCTGEDLWQILLGVSAKQTTVHELCAGLENAPSDSAVLGYLNEQLTVDRLPELEARLNAALVSQIPRRVFKRARDTAIDFHDQAYYGKTEQAEAVRPF